MLGDNKSSHIRLFNSGKIGLFTFVKFDLFTDKTDNQNL